MANVVASASAVTGRRAPATAAYHRTSVNPALGSMDGAGRPRVLVVDDDPDVLASLERGLRLSGFEVSHCRRCRGRCAARRKRAPTQSFSISTCRCSTASAWSPRCAMDSDVAVCADSALVRSTTGWPPGNGADDYLVKPFVLAGWWPGSKALLRRHGTRCDVLLETIQVGPLGSTFGQRARVGRSTWI